MRQGVLAAIAGSQDANRCGDRFVATLLTLVTLMLLASATSTVSAQTGPPQVEIEVIPIAVELPSRGEVEVLIVARNPSVDVLHNIQFSWFTDAGVNVTAEAPVPDLLVPYGTVAWTVRLSQTEDGPVAGTVHLRIDYSWEGASGNGAVPCVALGSLEVTAREPEAVDQVVEVRAETAVTSLMEHRPSTVYLIVTSISDVPIQVTNISPSLPEFLTFTLPDLGTGVTLGPRETRSFPIKIAASGAVQPGKHLLLFETAFEWKKTGRAWTGNAIATHEVEVGILGESEILTAVGVPSFLVLPGFLMVITVGLLWRFVGPRIEFPLKAKSAEFWLLAITLSMLTALVYPVVTGWHGVARNYLEGYGLRDVLGVWLASVVTAAATYFVVAGGISLYARVAGWHKRWKAQQRIPSAKDTPIAILRKFHKQNLGISRDRVEVMVEGELQRAYLLQSREEGQEKIWIGPTIIVERLAGASADLQQKVGRELNPSGSVDALATLLEEGQRRGVLRVKWKRMGRLTGPYEANTADLQGVPSPNVIIEQE